MTNERGATLGGGTSVHFAPDVRAQIEAWRKAQPAIPSLRAAVDAIVRKGLDGFGFAPKVPVGGIATVASAKAAKRARGK